MNTLKNMFAVMFGTLCLLLLTMVVLVGFKKVDVDTLIKVVGFLGIPTLFGSVMQAFIHSDFNKDGIPDSQQVESVTQTTKNTISVPKEEVK